jgi:hypothetical protein
MQTYAYPQTCDVKTCFFYSSPVVVLPMFLANSYMYIVVSPAYGFSALALVKCSNEGGPGPRHNMKEDPGTFTLIMKREHGCHLYLMPWFSESGDNRNRRLGLPPPPEQPGQSPLPPPFKYTPLPQPEYQWRPDDQRENRLL